MDRRAFLSSTTAGAALALLPYRSSAQTAAAPAPAAPGDAVLTKLYDKQIVEFVQRSPEFATQLGFDKGPNAPVKHKLSDNSPAAKAANRAKLKEAIAAISAVDAATLSDKAKLDREVILYSMNSQTVAQDKYGIDSVIRPFPIFQQGGAYFSMPDFLNTAHTIKTAEDCEAYLDRVAALGKFLDNETAEQAEEASRGYVAPDFSLDLTLAQMKALRSPAPADNTLTQSLVRRAGAANVAGDWSARCAKIVGDTVYPALDRQFALMTKLRATARTSAGLWDVPRGEEIYADALKQATTTNYTAEEVHKLGLAQVAEISAELDKILKAQGLTKGSVAARLNQLNVRADQVYPNTPEGRKELLASLNAGNAAMQAKLVRAFNNPPTAPLEIRAVPVEIQDGASNGYYNIAALDGSRPAIYFINLKDVGDWPKYSLPALTYHEGVPGHHLQLSEAQRAPTPLLRKLSFFGAYSEGWALYAEGLADELGGYATPLERAGFLQSYLFRAARLVIDTGIHTKRWSREKATQYMVDTVGFAQPRSQREVERYCTQPGQATSYKVGHAAWQRARADAQKVQGAKFDLKAFHDVVKLGALPLVMLERIAAERARATA